MDNMTKKKYPKTQRPSKMIRIYETSWKRFKIVAARKGSTLIQVIEDFSKK